MGVQHYPIKMLVIKSEDIIFAGANFRDQGGPVWHWWGDSTGCLLGISAAGAVDPVAAPNTTVDALKLVMQVVPCLIQMCELVFDAFYSHRTFIGVRDHW